MSTRWASSHIRAHFPLPTSLLRPENYDFLALNAESGNNVIQFARRSSGCGKRVSGTTNGPAPVCALMRGSEYQASPADSLISHKRKNRTYNNGPRHSGKAILCFVAVFAGFWLGVAAVSAYVHFSGR